jgi:hypothetical protein
VNNMGDLNLARALTGLIVAAVVVGAVIGVIGTKGCEYLNDHVNVDVQWRSE